MKRLLAVLLAFLLIFSVVAMAQEEEGMTLEDLDARISSLEKFVFYGFVLTDFYIDETGIGYDGALWRTYFVWNDPTCGLTIKAQGYSDDSYYGYDEAYGWLKAGPVKFKFGYQKWYYAYYPSASGLSMNASNLLTGYGYNGRITGLSIEGFGAKLYVPATDYNTTAPMPFGDMIDNFRLTYDLALPMGGLKIAQWGLYQTFVQAKLGFGNMAVYPGLKINYTEGADLALDAVVDFAMATDALNFGANLVYSMQGTVSGIDSEIAADMMIGDSIWAIFSANISYNLTSGATDPLTLDVIFGGYYFIGNGNIEIDFVLGIVPDFTWMIYVEFIAFVA